MRSYTVIGMLELNAEVKYPKIPVLNFLSLAH